MMGFYFCSSEEQKKLKILNLIKTKNGITKDQIARDLKCKPSFSTFFARVNTFPLVDPQEIDLITKQLEDKMEIYCSLHATSLVNDVSLMRIIRDRNQTWEKSFAMPNCIKSERFRE